MDRLDPATGRQIAELAGAYKFQDMTRLLLGALSENRGSITESELADLALIVVDLGLPSDLISQVRAETSADERAGGHHDPEGALPGE